MKRKRFYLGLALALVAWLLLRSNSQIQVAPVPASAPRAQNPKDSSQPRENVLTKLSETKGCDHLFIGDDETSTLEYFKFLTQNQPANQLDTDIEEVLSLWEGAVGRGNSRLARFFRAVQLAEDENQTPDRREAIRLLEELKNEDPQNRAYSFFLFGLKSEEGVSDSELKGELNDLLKPSEKFDSHLLQISQRVYQLGLQSPKAYGVAIQLNSRIQVPNFGPSYRALTAPTLSLSKTQKSQLLDFGKLMAQQGIAEQKKRELVSWYALEYQVGYNLIKKSWKDVHPDRPMNPRYVPFNELPGWKEQLANAILVSDCTEDKLAEQIGREKKIYAP